MDIKRYSQAEKPELAILSLCGELDGSNYQEVIQTVQAAFQDGAHYLLIDLREVPFMGSTGLVALHSAALIMCGDTLPDPEDGWGALHAVGFAVAEGRQPYVKLLGPQPSVDRSLEK